MKLELGAVAATAMPHDERLCVRGTILLALVSMRTNAARSAPVLPLTNLDGFDAPRRNGTLRLLLPFAFE